MDEFTKKMMGITEEEEQFLNWYETLSEDMQVLVQKFVMGNEQEQEEAEKIVYRMLDEAREQGRL